METLSKNNNFVISKSVATKNKRKKVYKLKQIKNNKDSNKNLKE